MPHLTRRGFTMIELLVGLVLVGIVSAGIYRVLVNNQRIYEAQTQRIDLLQNIRAGASLLPAELRELDASEGDILSMSATAIRIRAMRQLAFLCELPILGGGSPLLKVRRSPFYGLRDFDASRDGILVHYEGDQGTRRDDSWVLGGLTAVQPDVCPDASPAWRLLTTNLVFSGPLVNQTGTIQSGAPVRGFEQVTYGLYQATTTDNRWYIGIRDASGTTQPLVGPLLPNGLELAYFDVNGNETGDRFQVASIRITLRAESQRQFRQLDQSIRFAVDSVTTWVALRNNLRY